MGGDLKNTTRNGENSYELVTYLSSRKIMGENRGENTYFICMVYDNYFCCLFCMVYDNFVGFFLHGL